MRKLLAIATLISGTLFMVSCGEDDTPITFDDPSINLTIGDVAFESSATLSGTITVDADLASNATWTATVTGGSLDAATGELTPGSNDVSLTFTAASGYEGTAVIVIDVSNPSEDTGSGSASATITFNVLEEGDNPITFNTNGNIPATASLVVGATLAVTGVDIDGADGIASVTATVNGTVNADLGQTYDGMVTTATYDFSVNTGDLGVGTYVIVFTATDSDGDEATFSHALTVEALGFDVVNIEDLDTDMDDDPLTNPEPAKEITGSINSDYTFTNDVTWVLAGRIKVTNGATLTIEAGTVIKGRTGTGGNATALVVTRGSNIEAIGTATAPIILTAIRDELTGADVASGDFVGSLDPAVNGEWGGLIVLGDAPIVAAADEVQIEGIPSSDPDGLYGGTDAAHDAGTIRYVSVRHGGSLIGDGNEINGITFGGVGSGTEVAWVEVVGNQDDGIEWFGGNVNVSNALIWNAGDDGLDTDQDWQGTCDGFLIVTPIGSAFELDGPEPSGASARDNGFHTFTNGTVYAGTEVNNLVDWDGSTNAGVNNVYFYGIQDLYVDGVASFGGDGNGPTNNWQITLDGTNTISSIFGGDAGAIAITTAVNANANTVGVQDETGYEWTFASQSGALSGIGL